MSSRSAWSLTLVTFLVLTVGCSQQSPRPASSGGSRPAVITVGAAPRFRDLKLFSPTYRLKSPGPQTQTIRLPLAQRLPRGWAVVVATRQTSSGPWSYLPADLSPDRHTAIFTGVQHGLFTVAGENLTELLHFFQAEFVSNLKSEPTATARPPACKSQSTARSGYNLTSTSGSAVSWCFGVAASGDRILRIVNNRPYPLEIQHSGLAVAEQPTFGYATRTAFSYLFSSNTSILAPGAQIGYRVSLPPGQAAEAQAEVSIDESWASLLALQAGLNALLAILVRLGDGGDSMGVTMMNEALSSGTCADAMMVGNPGSILASCLNPGEMAGYFGSAGFLLAPLVLRSGLARFFGREFQAVDDVPANRSNYVITLQQNSGPVVLGPPVGLSLCSPWEIRPSSIELGCGAIGVSGIRWSAWTAVGNSDRAGNYRGSASGTGILDWVACPGGSGPSGHYQVALTLTRPRETKDGWIWSDMVIQFTVGHPAGLNELRLTGLPDFKSRTCIFTEG